MFTRKFWEDAAERAIRAGAWAALSFLGVASQVNALTVDWATTGGMFARGLLLSLLGSLVGSKVGDPDTAALLPSSGGGRHELR
jgi:hypothetical protein